MRHTASLHRAALKTLGVIEGSLEGEVVGGSALWSDGDAEGTPELTVESLRQFMHCDFDEFKLMEDDLHAWSALFNPSPTRCAALPH